MTVDALPCFRNGNISFSVLALRGEKEACLDWLNKAFDLGWQCCHHFRSEPKLAAVRGDPKFGRLLSRMR